jgi:hypothetical protein
MDAIVTYNGMVVLVANLPSIVPCPKFANSCVLQRHLQRALQFLNCHQSTIHGWTGLIMACPMYALLTTMPFRVPTDPGFAAVYYQTPIKIVDIIGASLLDTIEQRTYVVPTLISCTKQATIDTYFNCATNSWLLYMNIQHVCYNILDNNINNAFKVTNNLALVGWNPATECTRSSTNLH